MGARKRPRSARPPGMRRDSLVGRRIPARPIAVVEAIVTEANVGGRESLMVRRTGKERRHVTAEALESFAAEERFASQGRRGHRGAFPSECSIVGSVERDQCALKRGQGARDIRYRKGPGCFRKRRSEKLWISADGTRTHNQLVFEPCEPKLDRILAEHRDQRLIFEPIEGRVGPGQRRYVRHVGEAHAATRMDFSSRADRAPQNIRERHRLFVATCA